MDWKMLFEKAVIEEAEQLVEEDHVQNVSLKDDVITADVLDEKEAHVSIFCLDGMIEKMECGCERSKDGHLCKHMAAALMVYENKLMMEKVNKNVRITCSMEKIITYAMAYNKGNIIKELRITNKSEEVLKNLRVRISSKEKLIKDQVIPIEELGVREEKVLKDLPIEFYEEDLTSITKRTTFQIKLELYDEKELLAFCMEEIDVLAFDQWTGLRYTPELLPSFVIPDHPLVIDLIGTAAKHLENWTQDAKFEGYRSNDMNRINYMAAAVYAAIQQKNISYAKIPEDYEKEGQKVRLPETILEQHIGTCLDLTLLYVSCLEALELNPIIVVMKDHIFAGVWLIDESFKDQIMYDLNQLINRSKEGINELMLVECTSMCAGKTTTYDEAIVQAKGHLQKEKDFSFVIDVKVARKHGIQPLPVRTEMLNGLVFQNGRQPAKDTIDYPENFPIDEQKDEVTKQGQWERKLLDLSLRNMLINLRLTKSVVPLISSDISSLEDALSDGEEFKVLPRSEDMPLGQNPDELLEHLDHLGFFKEFIELETRHKRLHAAYTEKELNRCLTKMYRSAKSSMEENGASTLYLALGLLRWFESKKDAPVRYAPIVLVPIEIIRKSANQGYTMCMKDEEAQINITLLEFLKQKYNLTIHGLNPPPEDEHGLDLKKTFAIVRHAVMNFPKWEVLEAGIIGNFSFSQFVMWNDIHTNSHFLETNPIVKSLIDGAVKWDAVSEKDVDEEAYVPLPADASQLKAINMAASDASFVLHGPPGTGKSQTITGLISNALAKGNTVLFAAEKMAALEVVQKRLTALGIEDFCLELHSNKATKKAVLDQLRRGLEHCEEETKTNYEEKIRQIRIVKGELDSYAEALHKRRASGKSMRQMIDYYETIRGTEKMVQFDHAFAGSLTENDLLEQLHKIQRMLVAGESIGHPYQHPLRFVHQMEYSQELKFNLEPLLKEYMEALYTFQERMNEFVEEAGLEKPKCEEQWNFMCTLSANIAVSRNVPAFLRGCKDVDQEFSQAAQYLCREEELQKKKEEFEKNWNSNFLKLDMNGFQEKYEAANQKIFFKNKALEAIRTEIQAYASFTVEVEKLPVYFTDITFLQKEEEEQKAQKEKFSKEWTDLLESYSTEESLLKYKEQIKNHLAVMSWCPLKIDYSDPCIDLAGKTANAKETADEKEKKVVQLLDLSFEGEKEDWIAHKIKICQDILDHQTSIKEWIIYRQFVEKCKEAGLEKICQLYEQGFSPKEVIQIYERSIYQAAILSVIEQEPVLNRFTGVDFNERILQFKKMDEEFMELTKKEIRCQLMKRLPSSAESVEISKELNLLRRAISSNGRGISIRTLFDAIPHVLARLCPCMLMSPISAAQYLKPENDVVDLVVFDEASQIPTCKAVGVLSRGKNAVIVGDPNQMPPTSFFAGNAVDEENLDLEDLDSILDDCLALGMPQTYLKWHYRSRHESLIAFSNREFYENTMFTFPSVNDQESKVHLKKVEGFFDRGRRRTNEAEAKAIVQEIMLRYKDKERCDQSVGVVTFNIPQQMLIEDLLQEEYQKDAAFDRWANEKEEPVFVKNLENVQGDERDVILFSVAYGPDEEGKMYLNFGPLNRDGGWKRLNVAVSRAKMEMLVFTIMDPEMINLKRTKARGVEALKDFLEYAKDGRLKGEYKDSVISKEEGILQEICTHLENIGYEYRTSIGHSRFKIDVGVIDPLDPSKYILGIMLDGESYRQSENTKDRELAQIGVLKRLGWNLVRIWTMDWWDNKEKELSKLTELLEQSKRKGEDGTCMEQS